MIAVSEDPIDTARVLKDIETANSNAGAIVSFSGQVRDTSATGSVKALLLQSYSPMTENGILCAVNDAKSKWKLCDVRVLHRNGRIEAGETIVFVATAAAHRRAAFEACDFLMDYLKTEAVFWKKEITSNGEHWIEPREADFEDANRWTEKGLK